MSLLMKRQRNLTWVVAGSLGFLALLGLGCDTDSPTAPQQVPAPFPSGGSGARWNVSITISPSGQIVGGTVPSIITIRVTRVGGGDPPANGTSAAVTTTLGELNTAAVSGSQLTSLAVGLVGGRADIFFFPGGLPGEAFLTAQVERDAVDFSIPIRADELFITSITPNTGPQGGGTKVKIEGVGFVAPLQVMFGDAPGTNVDVGRQGLKIDVNTPRVLDPDSFFDTESCDADGDGVEDGLRMLPTAIDVTVQLSSGGSGTFPNGFVYNPSNRNCVEAADPPPDPIVFIQSVTPNTGPATGGTPVTITGRGFRGALRVFFQNKLATVVSSTTTSISTLTPPGDLATESCDLGGGAVGTRFIDTPVQVKVELLSGPSETLPDGFTYLAPVVNPCI
jgi:hypothetical protein